MTRRKRKRKKNEENLVYASECSREQLCRTHVAFPILMRYVVSTTQNEKKEKDENNMMRKISIGNDEKNK